MKAGSTQTEGIKLNSTVFRNRAPSARTRVIPNGIDPQRFDPTQEKQPLVLCVTRIFECKGVQYLVNAARTKPEPWRVIIAGDGPYMDEIRRRAEKADDCVELVGFLENTSNELRWLYESAAIFAFPSIAENFPVCLLEAMTAGCAIVTTDGTGCAEVVGDAAILIEPKKPGSASKYLSTFVGLAKNKASGVRSEDRAAFRQTRSERSE